MSPKANFIRTIENEVCNMFNGEGTGHDWWHIHRVRNMALTLGKSEQVDLTIVELGALLHDIADYKFHNGDETIGPRKAIEMMQKHRVPSSLHAPVAHIVEHISFKGAHVPSKMGTPEGKVVQDADRLDAIGAIGIARVFSYGGSRRRPLWNPNVPVELHTSSEAYMKNTSSSINHFYQKLLLIKDRMNTAAGRSIAEKRHEFLEHYLEQFYAEWEGKA